MNDRFIVFEKDHDDVLRDDVLSAWSLWLIMMIMILKIFIIAVNENMIDIFYFGPLILKTVELCLKKVSACYRDRDLFNMAKMTAKHQKLCDPL